MQESNVVSGEMQNNAQNGLNSRNDTFGNIVSGIVEKIPNEKAKTNVVKTLNKLKEKIFNGTRLLSFKEQLAEKNHIETEPYLVKDVLQTMPMEFNELNDKSVVISQKVLNKAVNKHNVPMDVIENLDKILENPAAVIELEPNENGMKAVAIYSNIQDHRGLEIHAVVYPESKISNTNIVVDSISSIYGENLQKEISKAVSSNKRVWENEKRDISAIGPQLSKANTSTNSMHQNSKFDNVTPANSDNIRHLHAEKLVDDTKSSNRISSFDSNNQLITEKINQESSKNPNQSEKTVKVQKYEKAARNKLIQYLSNEFNVSPYQVKSLVGEWIDRAGEQMQSCNKVDTHLMKDIFNKMADNSYTVNDEMRMKNVVKVNF